MDDLLRVQEHPPATETRGNTVHRARSRSVVAQSTRRRRNATGPMFDPRGLGIQWSTPLERSR